MRKIFYYFAALLFVLYGLIATNIGLQSLFWFSKLLIPGTLTASQLTGSLITPIEIKDFQYETTDKQFKSSVIIVDFNIQSLIDNTIDIPLLILQNAELKFPNHDAVIIHKVSAAFKRQFDGSMTEIKIPEFDAQWKDKSLHIFLGLRLIDKQIYFLNNLSVKWGKSQFNISRNTHQDTLHSDTINQVMQYQINLEEPTYSVHMQGTLKPILNYTNWLGNVENLMIQWPIGTKWVIKQASQFQFSTDTLQGSLQGQIQDYRPLYTIFPQISRIIGIIEVEGKLSGSLQKPIFNLSLKSQAAQFDIPKYKLKVTKLNLHIHGDMPGILSLEGKGSLGEGIFNLEGTSHAFNTKNAQNWLTLYLKGDYLKIANQAHYLIVASPDVNIKYEKNKNLIIDGVVKIDEAYIHIDEHAKRLIPSRDVVVVHSKSTQTRQNLPSTIKIIPNIQFILENKTLIKGYGLEGNVGGKLQIEERTDGLLTGTGRLTIKEGRYRLQGKNRYIHRGRLLFPQGTLLTDPILDIKVTETKTGEIESDTDASIYVQGTLQSPVYQLYSASGMEHTEILSKLGIGIEKETTQRKFSVTKSASLLAGSNPFMDKLSALLGLEELSVTTRETESSQQNLSKTDTVLVVGKWLTDRLYIQYFQSVLEPISTGKIRYRLNQEFTASVESGTEGQGADLIYSIERD